MSDIKPDLIHNAEIPFIVDQEQFTIEIQKYYSGHNEKSKKLEWTTERIESVIKLLDDYNIAKSQGKRPTNKQYHHASKYDIMNVRNQKVLIMKRKTISDPVVQIIPTEEYYQTILDVHIATGHGRRDKIVHALRNKYVVPIFAINKFINLCKTCLSKKNFPKSRIVVKPLISDDFNTSGQVDLVNFQSSPDEEYKWLHLEQNAEIPFIDDQEQFTIELQKYYSGHNEKSKKLEWTSERIESVIKLLDDYNIAKSQGKRPTNKQYHHASKYDIMNVGNQKFLIMKRKKISDPVVQIIPTEEYYQTILDVHIATGHGRRDKIVHALKNKYVVPIFAINIFINLCKTCLSKKNFPKSQIVVKPLISDDFNRMGQVDLVDFQSSPDEEYKWLLHYQDHLTKFCFLRPLKSKQAKEVAIEILKIFLEVGCPNILQSDNGREFTASVLKQIVSLWPACKIVHGTPRYPQSQGSIKHSNQDIKNMIWAWMAANKSMSWSIGCYFIQYQKNSSYCSTIARTPYKALFGMDPKLGLSSTYLSKNIIGKLETEEDVERVIKELDNNKTQISEIDIKAKEQENVPTIIRTEIGTITKDQEEVPIVGHELVNQVWMCYICNKEASEEHTCINCYKVVHISCGVVSKEEGVGSQLLCNLCVNVRKTVQSRKQSHINLKRAAYKTIATSSKKIKDICIGSSMLVEVPKLDRGPMDSKNLIGKVLDNRSELYQVATAFGTIKDWLPRNDVISSPSATLPNDINRNYKVLSGRRRRSNIGRSTVNAKRTRSARDEETSTEREARLSQLRERNRDMRERESTKRRAKPSSLQA